jgi:hypothetical protein
MAGKISGIQARLRLAVAIATGRPKKSGLPRT